MTDAHSVFARTKSKNIADTAAYDAVVNLLKRSTLSSILQLGNRNIDGILEELRLDKAHIATLEKEIQRLDKHIKTKITKEK